MSLWSRLANVFRPARVERDLDEELQFHIAERIRELTAAGMTREAAAEQASRRFGNPLRLREQSRDVKLHAWLDSLLRDVRLGLRMLRKQAGVTGAAILSLSLALGACVAAFSLVDALILRPLPVRHPEQLVYLTVPAGAPERPEDDTFSDPLFMRLRDAARGRFDLIAIGYQVIEPVSFTAAAGAGERERLRLQFVSGDAFDVLGVIPTIGRLFTRQDDVRPGAHPVAIMSHALWMRRFGDDPSVIGQWVTLGDGRQLQIVGVAEPRFTGVEPGRPTDLWFPYAMNDPHSFGNADYSSFRIVARLNETSAWRKRTACSRQRSRTSAASGDSGRKRRPSALHASSGCRSFCDRWRMGHRRCGTSSSGRCGPWPRSRRWCCSSRDRTSRTCSWPGPRRPSARCRSVCRSARAAGD
ncbi:MAG: hypothetical protein GEU99_05230 [Luteitalea sp.]|nr:hypothetical protein [Luteitalea sp.]